MKNLCQNWGFVELQAVKSFIILLFFIIFYYFFKFYYFLLFFPKTLIFYYFLLFLGIFFIFLFFFINLCIFKKKFPPAAGFLSKIKIIIFICSLQEKKISPPAGYFQIFDLCKFMVWILVNFCFKEVKNVYLYVLTLNLIQNML